MTKFALWAMLTLLSVSTVHAQEPDYRFEIKRSWVLGHEPSRLEIEAMMIPIGAQAPDLYSMFVVGDSNVALNPKGKLLLLDFWFAGCPPCEQALQYLKQLRQRYSEDELSILGLNPYNYDSLQIVNYWKHKSPGYPAMKLRPQTEIDYGIFGYPTLYLLDEKRRVIWRKPGYGPKVDKELDEIIAARLR
jgi:thiol-disulfide isomerase/thioredoxin